jgi:predicted restriction endonuclease
MLHLSEIWDILQTNMQKGRWISLKDIYQVVENNWNLDVEDFEPQSPSSDSPKWKRNVRNVLQYRKGTGEILWDSGKGYLIASVYTYASVLQTPKAIDLNEPAEAIRTQCTIYRVLRDTALAREIKAIHNNKCQICGNSLQLGNGALYAEAHHIKPLGSPHNGPDVRGNILCVCPNHHVLLDYGAIKLDVSSMRFCAEHCAESIYTDYHNSLLFGKIR